MRKKQIDRRERKKNRPKRLKVRIKNNEEININKKEKKLGFTRIKKDLEGFLVKKGREIKKGEKINERKKE